MTHSKHPILKVSFVLVLLALMLLIPLSIAFADSTGTPGQPNQSCEDAGVTPGSAVSAPGSAFNPGGVAGGVYAGEQPQNSTNPNSVSQYDVACFQVSLH
jgi:hypothetical protein